MGDAVRVGESTHVEKYSDGQVERSRGLLGGREPSGDDLRGHHDTPGHGVVHHPVTHDHDAEGRDA